ncbi:response regulator transcription factor [Shewanella surugensis]|uniref:response regulator transcription factor n=1 Tax=Shewanella surugensis TaxID=212020 RepID=UPI00289992C2|nr:response regulator transcription factor [Shewanella surugensis]
MILIVEDNRALATNMIEFFETHGYECDYADNGPQGLLLAKSQRFNAIILDIMLPRMDGLSVCQSLREAGNQTPILMLTALDSLDNKLQGFNTGADDYLVKPFDLPELMARVHVLIRRSTPTHFSLNVADLTMDIASREVTRAGHPIELNRACWQILEALLRASPNVLTRQEIEHIIWSDELPDSDVLKSHIYQLRQKVDKPFKTPLLHTVRGVGLTLKLKSA